MQYICKKNALCFHKNFRTKWKSLTCTFSDLISWLVSGEVAVHAFVGVADVPLVARLSDLPCTALAAATAIQDGADPGSTVRPVLTLTGPLAELSPLRNSLPISGSQLCITLSTAETLCLCVCGEGGEYNTTHYTLYLLLTETCYSQSGLAHWKLHFKAFNGLNNPDVLKWHSKERKGKIYFWTVSYHFNY